MGQHTEWGVVPIGDDGHVDMDHFQPRATVESARKDAETLTRADSPPGRWVVVRRSVTATDWVEADPPKDSPLDVFVVPRSWLTKVKDTARYACSASETAEEITRLVNAVLANEPRERSRRD